MKKYLNIASALLVAFVLAIIVMTFYYEHKISDKNHQIEKLQNNLIQAKEWFDYAVAIDDKKYFDEYEMLIDTHPSGGKCKKLIESFWDDKLFSNYYYNKIISNVPAFYYKYLAVLRNQQANPLVDQKILKKIKEINKDMPNVKEYIKCLDGKQPYEDFEEYKAKNKNANSILYK
ncbi:MAG: hypothetical protein LBT96_02930 [Campylobacteraceae bacterium]|jgi:hypothetical protein|nr:hypothetical protein [Campylobacteraceae bacterium]